jgi:hypothetical protein
MEEELEPRRPGTPAKAGLQVLRSRKDGLNPLQIVV